MSEGEFDGLTAGVLSKDHDATMRMLGYAGEVRGKLAAAVRLAEMMRDELAAAKVELARLQATQR